MTSPISVETACSCGERNRRHVGQSDVRQFLVGVREYGSIEAGVSRRTLPLVAPFIDCTAIWPPAPALFSTNVLLVQSPRSFPATRRQNVSVVPPGGKPVTIFTKSSVCGLAPVRGVPHERDRAKTDQYLQGMAALDHRRLLAGRRPGIQYGAGCARLVPLRRGPPCLRGCVGRDLMAVPTSRPVFEHLDIVETGRRRRWTEDEKLRIVAESLSGSRQVSSTARRHGISRSLLTTWRRQFRVQPQPGGEAVSGFVPAVVLPEGPGQQPTGFIVDPDGDRRVG
jgi:Transposase